MPVKVRDVLNLKLMSSYRIVAGYKGLDKEIKRINFTDCPLGENDDKLVMPNDFFINSFYMSKGDIGEIKKMIEFYISTKSSGVCIINEYMRDIPDEIKKIANKERFPVIFIDNSVPYAEIIRIATEMILLEQIQSISERSLDKLMDAEIDKGEVKDLALKINGEFKRHYMVLDIGRLKPDSDHCGQLISGLNRNPDLKTLKYKHHLIVIMNFDKESMAKTNMSDIRSMLEEYSADYVIGASNIFSSMEDFNIAMRQAKSANGMSGIINKNVILYKELNVYKLLYLLKDTRELKEYHAEVIEPLMAYDNCYNTNLLETVEGYLENGGDYKKAAENLYLHENTVRYRILKAKKILNLENNPTQFIEQVYIGLKINNILNKRGKSPKKGAAPT